MKLTSAYKSLCQAEKQILADKAKDVALLVTDAPKLDYFRERLREFAEEWKAFKTAYDADRKGKWQPSMGKPYNPLGTISTCGAGRVLSCGGDILPALGAYALLAIIHDRVLPKCPTIATGILPKELADKIWRDLVTGAQLEGRMIGSPKWVIPTSRIEGFLQGVKAEIENHFAPPDTKEQPNGSADDKPGESTPGKPQSLQSGGVASNEGKAGKKHRGRPKEYSEEHKTNCNNHYQEWKTYYATWNRTGQKGSARHEFAKSKHMQQKKSDAMIRYGTPTRKKSRRKSRG